MSHPRAELEGQTHPRLLGVRIAESAPIEDLILELPPGFNVLYGRNGAGKTRILQGIAECAATQATTS
ncbi:MAG TPA: hypothetical protein VMM60_05430, partial [Ilumatobacter sp.]|nr:hypothetical protein [Ilumatobacter sp.]